MLISATLRYKERANATGLKPAVTQQLETLGYPDNRYKTITGQRFVNHTIQSATRWMWLDSYWAE